MRIIVNGKSAVVEDALTVYQYLIILGLSDANAIAVALNKEILQRELYKQTQLNEGDQLEIVRAIGGGK